MKELFLCKSCGKRLNWMEMHNEEQCKVCWLKAYKRETPYRMTTYRKNKLLLGSG